MSPLKPMSKTTGNCGVKIMGPKILMALKNKASSQSAGCHSDGPNYNDSSGDPNHDKSN